MIAIKNACSFSFLGSKAAALLTGNGQVNAACWNKPI
jgi:hypothetical protein